MSRPIPTLVALTFAAAMWWSVPASAQQPAADDPTAQTADRPSRPGVLNRPGTQPTTADGADDGDSGDNGDNGDDGSNNGDSAGDTTTTQTGDATTGTGSDATTGSQQNGSGSGAGSDAQSGQATGGNNTDAELRRGPRVLEVEDVEPDVGAIDENFVEPFDPINPPSNVMVNIDFNEADLSDVVMWISALTGRNFIIADTISASKKITIISPRPVTIAEAERAFYAALNMNGLTVIPFGRFLKIVEADGAQREPLDPTESISQVPRDDRMVTHIHQLQHVSIGDVQSVLDALKTDAAQIVPYEPTNTLIITETGLNLRRLLSILEMLDAPSGQDQINLYQVQYAQAEDLRSVLLEIFEQDDGGGQAQSTRSTRTSRRSARSTEDNNETTESIGDGPAAVSVSQIISDERTNQLIIIANERSFQQILDVIAQLDVPIPGEGQVHVRFLENATATELASTLQSLTQALEQQREDSGGGQGDEDGGAIGATLTGDISITADEATNSLVVVASHRDFLALEQVIAQLDRRRQQVYVEAVIMEITMGRTNEFGVAFNGGALPTVSGEESPIFGATNVGDLSSLTLDPTGLMGLAVGIRGPSIDGSENALGIGIPSFGAILQAMQTDNDVNVLSTPHILTMDNEEAEIVVGENIPFISGGSALGGGGLGGLGSLGSLANNADLGDLGSSLGSLGSLGGLGGLGGFPSFNIQRQDVALTLRITPQINESNFVRLEIEEEVEDVQSVDPVLGPRTTTRQARTTVVVQDQQTIVIGGLMRDSTIRDVNKVPFLGDIPIIGHLFRQTTNRVAKTNLLLLLTPYIIRDPSDFQEIFRRKMEEREEFLAWFGRRGPEYVRSVDYGRKDGPMQSMYETILAAVEEDEARRRAFSDDVEEAPIAGPSVAPVRVDLGGGDPSPEAPASTPADTSPAAP